MTRRVNVRITMRAKIKMTVLRVFLKVSKIIRRLFAIEKK